MAGILANSPSKTMASGDTSADKTASGYVAGERITLTVTPSGTNYEWSQARPSGSSARAQLSGATGASVTFAPDVGGTYVVTCIVDGSTTYVIRITCQSPTISEPVEAVRLSPRTDASVPAPAAGRTLYYSSDQGKLVTKDSAGTVRTINET